MLHKMMKTTFSKTQQFSRKKADMASTKKSISNAIKI